MQRKRYLEMNKLEKITWVQSIHQAKHTVPVKRPTFSLSFYQSILWKFSLLILVVLLCLFIFHIHSLQNMI